MKGVEYRNKQGEIVGLLLDPKTGDLVKKNHLERLSGCMKSAWNQKENIFDGMECEDGKYVFLNEKYLDELVQLCERKITERIIVPQFMGRGPSIRHRVFSFEHPKDTMEIVVKYSTLGDFNNIDVALTELGV